MRDALVTLIRSEIRTRHEDEGCSLEQLEDFSYRLSALGRKGSESELNMLYQELLHVRSFTPGLREPSDLDGIRSARADGPRQMQIDLSPVELQDKILGGWLGRAAGCALGKPVEGWTLDEIQAYLEVFGESEVSDYFPYRQDESLPKTILERRIGACRGHIKFMPRDDDMDYTVIGLNLLRTYGVQFQTSHVGDLWLLKMPYQCTYTAERVAYKNLILGLTPPETAYYRNPYRQWIGAQIRADAFGYICPGKPELAAEMAWRDASLSHIKNGIYGAMWVAAAIAAAFVYDDVRQVIEIANTEIPTESRFAAMVRDVLKWSQEFPTWKGCWEAVQSKYGYLHRTHTVNNAALVLIGLLYGERDLGRTICLTVQGGWDTDCNGATAGSIIGVMLGSKALPARWVRPFNDTLETAVFGYNYPKFSDLAAATMEVTQKAAL